MSVGSPRPAQTTIVLILLTSTEILVKSGTHWMTSIRDNHWICGFVPEGLLISILHCFIVNHDKTFNGCNRYYILLTKVSQRLRNRPLTERVHTDCSDHVILNEMKHETGLFERPDRDICGKLNRSKYLCPGQSFCLLRSEDCSSVCTFYLNVNRWFTMSSFETHHEHSIEHGTK